MMVDKSERPRRQRRTRRSTRATPPPPPESEQTSAAGGGDAPGGSGTESTRSAARKLYRSRGERVLGGVCGGMAEYFGLDPTLVRLGTILAVFINGAGLLLYLAALLIVPLEPAEESEPAEDVTAEPDPAAARPRQADATFFWGTALLVLGCILFASDLPLVTGGALTLVHLGALWPLLLVGLGIWLLRREPGGRLRDGRRLLRTSQDRVLLGVCGGLSRYFDMDPAIVRVLWALLTIWTVGLGILLYIVFAVVMPEE